MAKSGKDILVVCKERRRRNSFAIARRSVRNDVDESDSNRLSGMAFHLSADNVSDRLIKD